MSLVRPPLSAPGVYIQEVPSGVHTVVGVSTSITAFLGRCTRGPIGEPVYLSSFDDFVKIFGGLRRDSALTYSVSDFFLNGGSTAIVIRLFEGTTADKTATLVKIPSDDPAADPKDVKAAQGDLKSAQAALKTAQANLKKAQADDDKVQKDDNASADDKHQSTLALKAAEAAAEDAEVEVEEKQTILGNLTGGVDLPLVAASAGSWATGMTYQTDTDGINDNVRARYAKGPWDARDLFNLTLEHEDADGTKMKERWQNVSLVPEAGERYLPHILEHKSRMARIADAPPPAGQKGADSGSLSAATYSAGFADLKRVDIFNLLVLPPDDDPDGQMAPDVYMEAIGLCKDRLATLIVDAPNAWEDDIESVTPEKFASDLGISAGDISARYAAVYFPRMMRPDPLRGGFPMRKPVSGAMAGIYARNDATRGVWSAPAGLEAGIVGAASLSKKLTDFENGVLNQRGINCLRSFPASGPVVWGGRTMRGDDQLSDDFKYLQVRRLADFIEESLRRGTQWAVFENNDEPLWAQLRLSIGGFMADLFRQGAFQGEKAKDAYFVRCDASTTLQDDIDRGIVNVIIGYAPLKPAEFVILYFEQIAGMAA